MAIAYFALCALHDLDASGETGPFREARLELHRLLDPQLADAPKDDGGRPPLYVVK
ncbi:MAG TPA: hypothetical protein VLI94_05385 [Solirubrobacterales bacterium]|nr:hypothetical protein [Solirubrobacterales bacterium]